MDDLSCAFRAAFLQNLWHESTTFSWQVCYHSSQTTWHLFSATRCKETRKRGSCFETICHVCASPTSDRVEVNIMFIAASDSRTVKKEKYNVVLQCSALSQGM